VKLCFASANVVLQEWLTGTLVHASERGFFVEVRRPGPEQGRADPRWNFFLRSDVMLYIRNYIYIYLFYLFIYCLIYL
jgi:hypothetical protein